MLKLAMLKCFCLKKKKFLYLAILPLRQSVLWRTVFCVFAGKQPDARPPTYLKVKAALPPDSRVRATFFFSSKTPFWWKMNLDIYFFFLGNKRLQHTQLKESLAHASTEPAGRPGPPAPLLSTAASPDSQEELTQLRMKTTTRSTVPRLSLVFLWSAWR